MERTRVVFRTWKRGEATVVALFPDTIVQARRATLHHEQEECHEIHPSRHGGRVGGLVLRAETSLQVRVFIYKEKMR